MVVGEGEGSGIVDGAIFHIQPGMQEMLLEYGMYTLLQCM